MLNLVPYASSESEDSGSETDETDSTDSSEEEIGNADQPKNATVRPPCNPVIYGDLYSNLPCPKIRESDAVQKQEPIPENNSKAEDQNKDKCYDVEDGWTLAIKKAKLDTETPTTSTSFIPSVVHKQIFTKSKKFVSKSTQVSFSNLSEASVSTPPEIVVSKDAKDDDDDDVVEVPLVSKYEQWLKSSNRRRVPPSERTTTKIICGPNGVPSFLASIKID